MRAASVLKSDNFISEDGARRCADYILYLLGNPGRLQIIVPAYKALPELQRAAARDCKERLQGIIRDTRRKGFSDTAIAYAVLGPLSKSHAQVFRTSLSPERAEEEAGEVRELLFAALKEAALKKDSPWRR
jgi:hypothetical protein